VYPIAKEETRAAGMEPGPDRLILSGGTALGESISPGRPWYVLYTRCHHEARVAKHLAIEDFAVLLPKYKAWSSRRDRRKVIDLPLFPGYLFVQTEPFPSRFARILETPGLARILGNGNGPEPVAQLEMESILILLSSGRTLEPHPYFKVGNQITVVSGPLCGAAGYIDEIQPNKRKLVISVELLGRSVAVHLSDELVDKV
jgi:transcription termination/antitermination protein NusG